ncbi:hypothetical protein WA158_007050 [Blastocystis sp. Blastoise]
MITASFIIYSLPIYVREYIGQTDENYFHDTHEKYYIKDLLSTTHNGRAQKVREYKNFIDKIRDSGYDIFFIIEASESLSKRIIEARNELSSLTRERIQITCRHDGYICITSKKETQILTNFISEERNTNVNVIPVLNSKNSSIDTTTDLSMDKDTIKITNYFQSKQTNNPLSPQINKSKEVTTMKLMAISRFISDSFASLLLTSSTTIDTIEKIYSLLPCQYQDLTVSSTLVNINHSVETNLQHITDENSITSEISDNSLYNYPIFTINASLHYSDQLFNTIQNVIGNISIDDKNTSLSSLNEKWITYLNSNISTIIQMISYITDDLLFYDIETYKNPTIKSILKHNGTYNKFICYNQKNKRWYCISCLIYSNDPMILGNNYTYSTIQNHMNTGNHRSSMKMFRKLLDNLKNNQTLLVSPSNRCVTTDNVRIWKYFLKIFYNCMCTCLSDIHSIYGTTTLISSPHCGMFITLLKLTAKNDPIFYQFLNENSKIYQSVRSIQRWIPLIVSNMTDVLRKRIGNNLFSITTDSTTSQNLEELVITIRYTGKDFSIHQYFLSILEETSPSGIIISRSILNCLKNYNFNKNNMCCVSFDNCVCNTSLTNGIITNLSLTPNSIIGYGCKVHLLNLALIDLQNICVDSSFYINTISDVASSWSRCSRLRVIIKNNGYSSHTLPQISQTRFTARYFSILPYIIYPKQTLCKIFLLYFYSYNKNTVCFKNCEKMLKILGEVSFHIYIECWFYLLKVINESSCKLQSETLTVSEALTIINDMFDKLSLLSSPQIISKIYNNSIKRREYIYSKITLLIHCLQSYHNDTENKECISSILGVMKNFDEYDSEFNIHIKDDIDLYNLDEDSSNEQDDLLSDTDSLDSNISPESDKSSFIRTSLSITESIASILNYRDETERQNLLKTSKINGVDFPKRKKLKQNVLINHDNDINMAPVCDN